MPTVRAISGAGGKGPACFLLEAGGARLLLDLGYGPQPGLWPDVSAVGRVDALVLTHSHNDHAGGLKLLAQVGNPPVYGTATVLGLLTSDVEKREIPLHGTATVCGVRFRTGRNGHAPGGVWLHAEAGAGLLYTGDYGVESPIYAHDAPPQAGTVILDASYGAYDASLPTCMAALDKACTGTACLLPVPVWGRGPEIAYHLARSGRALPRLGADVRRAVAALAEAPEAHGIKPEAAALLGRIAGEAPGPEREEGVLLVGPADASSGEAAAIAARWEQGNPHPIVFTGYVPPGTTAQRLMDNGRARYVRWNVHPRLRDNAALVRATRPRTVVPAFGDTRHRDAWNEAFAPARIAIEETITL